MKKVIFLVTLLLSAPLFARDSSALADSSVTSAVSLGNAYAAIVEHVKASVVSIRSERIVNIEDQRSLFDAHKRSRQVPMRGLGSGFFIDNEGHILTNDHVVHGMEKIHVVLYDGKIIPAKVLGSDAKTDLAVLVLSETPKNIEPLKFGDSAALKTGNIVLAIGAPFGLVQTVTSGIVSATGRSDVGLSDFEDFIQTDAPINPGNSGGPLVNTHGEVIAINSAIATSVGQSAGVGFAIPINMAKELLPILLSGKKIQRGMLGVTVQDVTAAVKKQFHLADESGALIAQVNRDSPADGAGLRTGDIILSFAGVQITNSHELRGLIAKQPPKNQVDALVVRDGREFKISVRLGRLSDDDNLGERESRAAEDPAEARRPLESFGIEARMITPDLVQIFHLHRSSGIVIVGVDETGLAAAAGLQAGDIIIEVNRKKISGVEDAERVFAYDGIDDGLLLIDRDGQTSYVSLERNSDDF